MADEPTLLTAHAEPAPVEAPADAGAAAPDVAAAPVGSPPDAHDWRPESLRGEKALEKYKSPEDAFKALVDAQKLIGKKADPLAAPGEEATQEERDAFTAKLRELRGVPTPEKAAEAYAIVPPADAPEGYELNADLVGAFQGLALEAGLAPAEFQKMADGYMALEVQSIIKMRQEAKARTEKEEAALVKGWQDEGKVPKEEFSKAVKAAQALELVGKNGTDSILGHLGNNTALIKTLAEKVYPLIAEGRLKGGGTEQNGPQYTPQEAFGKLQVMQRDPRYSDPGKRDPDFVREVDAFASMHGTLIRKGR